MRWDRLFDDAEGQWEQGRRAELDAEVADRTRRELGEVRLVDRLRPVRGAQVRFDCPGGQVVAGVLREVGPDWALVEEPGRRAAVVGLAHVLGVLGAGRASAPAEELEARWTLRNVLRELVRDRAAVSVLLRDGRSLTGTLDRVGQDHVDLAEHDADQPRRVSAVRHVRMIPLAAVAAVRRSA